MVPVVGILLKIQVNLDRPDEVDIDMLVYQ
jgi:hypothetical protein